MGDVAEAVSLMDEVMEIEQDFRSEDNARDHRRTMVDDDD
jgi:hypothetical protein